MTQDYAVQNKNASSLAWGGTGAIAGAAGGAALSKWANFGIPTQAYKSWDEAVAATTKDDEFIKKRIEKGGDNAANWKKLDDQGKAVKSAKDAILNTFPEGARANEDVSKYIDDLAKYKADLNTEAEKLMKEIADGKVVEGLDKDAATFADDVKKHVADKVESLKTQKTALEAAETKVKGISGVNDDIIKNVNVDDLIAKRKNAATELGEELLKNLKRPSMLWTAIAGAAALGLGALLLKPKNKEV